MGSNRRPCSWLCYCACHSNGQHAHPGAPCPDKQRTRDLRARQREADRAYFQSVKDSA